MKRIAASLGWVALVALAGPVVPATAARTPFTTQVPDLIVTVGRDSLRDASIPQGTNELRFSTRTANIGTYALRVGRVANATGGWDAVQEYSVDGVVQQQVFPNKYIFHVEHGHYHLVDYALYELRDAAGTLVTGGKASFCLLDSKSYDLSLPGAPKKGVYTSCALNPQGISVGWSDIYGSGLFGQSLSLVGVPDGTYDLVVTVNPLPFLLEESTSNNTSSVSVTISTHARTGQRRASVQ